MVRKSKFGFRNWRLQNKLLVILLSLSLLPVILLLSVYVEIQAKNSKHQMDSFIGSLVSGTVNELEQKAISFIHEHHTEIRIIALEESIIELLTDDSEDEDTTSSSLTAPKVAASMKLSTSPEGQPQGGDPPPGNPPPGNPPHDLPPV